MCTQERPKLVTVLSRRGREDMALDSESGGPGSIPRQATFLSVQTCFESYTYLTVACTKQRGKPTEG